MLDGSVAFVTGGGRGIGRAIARALAGARARVVVAARSTDQVDAVAAEIAAAGGEALSVTCDVAVSTSIEAAVGRAQAHFGPGRRPRQQRRLRRRCPAGPLGRSALGPHAGDQPHRHLPLTHEPSSRR